MGLFCDSKWKETITLLTDTSSSHIYTCYEATMLWGWELWRGCVRQCIFRGSVAHQTIGHRRVAASRINRRIICIVDHSQRRAKPEQKLMNLDVDLGDTEWKGVQRRWDQQKFSWAVWFCEMADSSLGMVGKRRKISVRGRVNLISLRDHCVYDIGISIND